MAKSKEKDLGKMDPVEPKAEKPSEPKGPVFKKNESYATVVDVENGNTFIQNGNVFDKQGKFVRAA